MSKKKTRAQIRKERYQRIVLETGNPTLARKYRDASPARIKAEIGVDVTRDPIRETQRELTPKEWSNFAEAKDYPLDVQAYAIQKNREVGADDFDSYGFIFAYKRLIEGKGERSIKREVVYDRVAQQFIYVGVDVVA